MLSDYTELIEVMKPVTEPGDIVEIGSLVGHGTRQLAEAWPKKAVHAVDVFNAKYDQTFNAAGIPMFDFYKSIIGSLDQWDAFRENTAGLSNVYVHKMPSALFKPPRDVFLTIIDAEHTFDAVVMDFNINRGSRYVAFHDYMHDIPEVTRAVDSLRPVFEERFHVGAFLVCAPVR